MFTRRGEERNYGVLIASLVAIVAIVGMVVYFSGGRVASGAAVAYSDLGDTAYQACASGNLPAGIDASALMTGISGSYEATRCYGAVCASLCAGTGDGSCGSYCHGRATALARNA